MGYCRHDFFKISVWDMSRSLNNSYHSFCAYVITYMVILEYMSVWNRTQLAEKKWTKPANWTRGSFSSEHANIAGWRVTLSLWTGMRNENQWSLIHYLYMVTSVVTKIQYHLHKLQNSGEWPTCQTHDLKSELKSLELISNSDKIVPIITPSNCVATMLQ